MSDDDKSKQGPEIRRVFVRDGINAQVVQNSLPKAPPSAPPAPPAQQKKTD